ncbi:MAG: PAS domain-containing protein, partial [Rhodanobacteraceae bacterium]
MPSTSLDTNLLDLLATGVARLDASLRLVDANPAFAEHTGFGHSRLKGHPLTVLAPDGARLHELAARACADGNAVTLRNATLCATPGRVARLDFTLTPCAEGVLVEAQPAAVGPDTARVSESLRGFAHEMRNPLAAISGAAQLLEQR